MTKNDFADRVLAGALLPDDKLATRFRAIVDESERLSKQRAAIVRKLGDNAAQATLLLDLLWESYADAEPTDPSAVPPVTPAVVSAERVP